MDQKTILHGPTIVCGDWGRVNQLTRSVTHAWMAADAHETVIGLGKQLAAKQKLSERIRRKPNMKNLGETNSSQIHYVHRSMADLEEGGHALEAMA